MRNCPYCHKKIKDTFPYLYEMEDGTWILNHNCRFKPFPALTVVIDIYGDSKQEVIDMWNGVYEEQTSESV